jgi:hypothetical protein
VNAQVLLAIVGVVFTACAGNARSSALPYCEQPDESWHQPDRSCRDDPDFIAFRNQLEELVVPAAGPLLVRVALDADGRVAEACAVRGFGPNQWTARRRLGALLAPAAVSSSGAPCAAGARLEFNRAEAAYEFIRVTERDCLRQGLSDRQFIECLDIWQERRGEIWIFGSNRRYRVFVPTLEASSRRTALLACTERRPASGSGAFPPVGIANVTVDLAECMKAEGWNELE